MDSISNLSHGRAVIPATLRAQLGLRDGDQLIWRVQGGELVATTRRAQLEKAQALFQSFISPASGSLADELIAERRAASEAE
jgi:bifunctional DNA-binding transcriptional regulator/antitoxin component of YhaV-PrlF toxin-antitoxin module